MCGGDAALFKIYLTTCLYFAANTTMKTMQYQKRRITANQYSLFYSIFFDGCQASLSAVNFGYGVASFSSQSVNSRH